MKRQIINDEQNVGGKLKIQMNKQMTQILNQVN